MECKDVRHFPHNYNHVSRAIMYEWFNKHLKLGLPKYYTEEDYELLTEAEMSVWNDEHPNPEGGEQYERELTAYLAETSDRQMADIAPKDFASSEEFRKVVGGALRTLVGREVPESKEVVADKLEEKQHVGYLSFKHIVRLKTAGETVPITSVWPTKTKWNGEVVIWLGSTGQRSLFESGDDLEPKVKELLEQGATVVAPDLFMQGTFLSDSNLESDSPQRVVKNPREAAAYSFCYNHTLFAQRVHDVLTLIAYVRGYTVPGETPEQLSLIATEGTGPLALAARAIAGSQVDAAIAYVDAFRFEDITSYRDPNFLPGIVKYGDVPALAALNAPHDLVVVGDPSDSTWSLTKATYFGSGGEVVLATKGEPVKLPRRYDAGKAR